MGMVESFRSMFSRQGKPVDYQADGFDPVTVSCIMKDFGVGAMPREINERFKKGPSRWFKITVVADDLPREPETGDIVVIGEVKAIVRQFAPVSMGGDPILYKIFANTDQRRK